MKYPISRLFVDGSFHDPKYKFLSKKKSERLFMSFIRMFRGPIMVGIYHVGVCTLLSDLNLRFAIHESISEKLKNQLEIIFEEHVDPDARLVLVKPAKYQSSEYPTIIPCALWFSCYNNISFINTIVMDNRGNWRINYSCHSDFFENMSLIQVVNPREIVILNKINKITSC